MYHNSYVKFSITTEGENSVLQAFLGMSLGAHVEAGCHSMVGDFDLISSQDAKILHA